MDRKHLLLFLVPFCLLALALVGGVYMYHQNQSEREQADMHDNDCRVIGESVACTKDYIGLPEDKAMRLAEHHNLRPMAVTSHNEPEPRNGNGTSTSNRIYFKIIDGHVNQAEFH